MQPCLELSLHLHSMYLKSIIISLQKHVRVQVSQEMTMMEFNTANHNAVTYITVSTIILHMLELEYLLSAQIL
jgi:hypothetical protein